MSVLGRSKYISGSGYPLANAVNPHGRLHLPCVQSNFMGLISLAMLSYHGPTEGLTKDPCPVQIG